VGEGAGEAEAEAEQKGHTRRTSSTRRLITAIIGDKEEKEREKEREAERRRKEGISIVSLCECEEKQSVTALWMSALVPVRLYASLPHLCPAIERELRRLSASLSDSQWNKTSIAEELDICLVLQ
jgi:hypothetical protein